MPKWKIALLAVAVPVLMVLSNVSTHAVLNAAHHVVRDIVRAMF
jgi:hypothetical protein